MPLPPEKIKVVYCAPGERAKIIEIEDSPASFEAVVHGPICKLAYDPTRITKYHLICNDVTSFMNEKPNRIYWYDWKIIDIIIGPFFIAKWCKRGYWSSLTDKQAEMIRKKYEYPDQFIYEGDRIVKVADPYRSNICHPEKKYFTKHY